MKWQREMTATDEHRHIQAIPTRYGGLLFRSRLEARWALFFDRLHIPWEYEPQGFDIGDGQAYLPDFLLGMGKIVWAEVKPSVWADEDGVARWERFMLAQKPGSRGVLLTSMNSYSSQEFRRVTTPGDEGGLWELSVPWSSCPAGYHFDLEERGALGPCRQCGETSKCPSCDGSGLHKDGAPCYCCDPPGSGRVSARKDYDPPWDDDKRISEAYSAAISARFGTG